MNRRLVYSSAVLSIFISLLTPLIHAPPASALGASDWRPGNIIDDGLFENADAMTVSQIQNWLNIRLQNCDLNGTQRSELSGGTDYNHDGIVTRAEYGKTYGNPAPFTCLNKYYEVPKTSPGTAIPASNYGKSTIPTGAKSAAQLIYDAGKAYNISPKVLLVKLGTESAGPLTSDTWPFKSQYTYAMGAHCPDSGPGGSANCDVNYSGFSLQMREAAKLLREYLDNMTQSWWTYKRPGSGVDQVIDSNTTDLCSSRKGVQNSNCVGWNVPRSCGGTVIYIQTKATAALYTYTPYQPNKASLSSYPGTGDSCSSYGNRNFWYVYSTWFGSSHLPQVFRTSSSTRTYLLSGSSYFYIPTPSLLRAYGFSSKDVGVVRDSDITALTNAGVLQRTVRFGSNEIYLVDAGKKFHFSSRTTLNAYGYDIGDESSLDANLAYSLPDGGTVSTVVNRTDDLSKFSIESTKKRHISSPSAYKTLGSPTYSTITPTNLSGDYVNTIPDGAPVLLNNSFTRNSDGSIGGFWDGTTLNLIDKSVLGNLKARTYIESGVSQLPQSTTTTKELVKTDSSNYYLLDSGKVYHLDATMLTNIGLDPAAFQSVSQAMITQLNPLVSEFKQAARINNSNAIYLLEDSKRYHFTSRRSLSDYGYRIEDAININSITAKHFTSSPELIYGTGSLIRVDGGDKIFLLNTKKSRVYVASRSMMEAYGFSFNKVSNVSSSTLGHFPIAGSLTNFVHSTVGADQVWLIDMTGIRRTVPKDLNTSTGYAIDPAQLITLDDNVILDFYRKPSVTQLLQAENSSPVYLIKDGMKHWVRSRGALTDAGFEFKDISIVSATSLNELPTGTDIH